MKDHLHLAPEKETVIASGITGYICKIDNEDSFIVKRPKRPFDNDDEEGNTNSTFYEALLRDRKAYERLGPHPGLIAYYGPYDDSSGAIKLAYAKEGDLEDYIRNTSAEPTSSQKNDMIQLIASTFKYIASKNISHHDVKNANILIQDGIPKICDFSLCYSTDGQSMSGEEDDETCPENHLRIDLSGLGCVFYSIAKWQVFDHDYYEEQRFLGVDELKPTEGLLWGEVIRKCWLGQFKSMNEMYDEVVLCTPELLTQV